METATPGRAREQALPWRARAESRSETATPGRARGQVLSLRAYAESQAPAWGMLHMLGQATVWERRPIASGICGKACLDLPTRRLRARATLQKWLHL